jgi:hypothetical protein
LLSAGTLPHDGPGEFGALFSNKVKDAVSLAAIRSRDFAQQGRAFPYAS